MRLHLTFITFFVILSCISGQEQREQQARTKVYPFSYNGQWGIIDENLKTRLQPSLEHIKLFRQDEDYRAMAVATQNGKKGLVGNNGKWVLKPKYDSITSPDYYFEHLRRVVLDGQTGLVTTERKRAKFLIKPQFLSISRFEGEKLPVAIITAETGTGAVNGIGDIIVEPIYDEVKVIDDFSDYPDLKLIKNDVVTYVDSWGQIIADHDKMREFEEDMIEFMDSAIDMEEEPGYREPEVDYRKNPSSGHWELITRTWNRSTKSFNENVITFEAYDRILKVKHVVNYNGTLKIIYIEVEKDGKHGLLSATGEILTPVIYDRISFERLNDYEEFIYTHEGDLIGFAGRNGQEVFSANYTHVKPGYSLIEVTRPDGYTGYANWDGQVFLPPVQE